MMPCVPSAAGRVAGGLPPQDWTEVEVQAATFADARPPPPLCGPAAAAGHRGQDEHTSGLWRLGLGEGGLPVPGQRAGASVVSPSA